MELWQYNAWCEAYKCRVSDELVIQVQAAYLGAYWSGFSKHKKSLESVIKSITRGNEHKKSKKKPINIDTVSNQFRQMEELKVYGYTKE